MLITVNRVHSLSIQWALKTEKMWERFSGYKNLVILVDGNSHKSPLTGLHNCDWKTSGVNETYRKKNTDLNLVHSIRDLHEQFKSMIMDFCLILSWIFNVSSWIAYCPHKVSLEKVFILIELWILNTHYLIIVLFIMFYWISFVQ